MAGLGRYDLPVYTGESRVSILDFDLGGRARHPDRGGGALRPVDPGWE